MSFQLPASVTAAAKPKATGHLQQSDISSTAHTFDQPFDLNQLRHVLTVSLMLYAKQIYRIKGIVKSKEDGKHYLLQSTGKTLQITPMPAPLPADSLSTLVVIGKGLKKEAIARLLRQGVAK
jgi:G3E family GTPase